MSGLRLHHPWFVLLAVGVIASSVPTVASAAFPGRNGRIAFTDDADHLMSVSPAGGRGRILARPPHGVGSASYKPDGREIVFDVLGPASPDIDVGQGSALYVKRASGRGRARRITRPFDPHARHGADDDADWSPDGQSVVFVRDYVGFEPFVPPVSGPCAGAPFCVRIYHRGRSGALVASAHSPVWSTRGLIAFRDDDDDWISVIRPDGSGRRRLARADLDGSFDWSPGGRRLVYADPDSKLSIIDANGSHVRRLKRSGDNPAFAPSGRMIVYSEPGGKLFTTDLRGRRRHLVRTNLDVFGPSDWQPLPRRGHR